MTMTSTTCSIPWVEKYRPADFDDIVLEPLNKRLLKNIIHSLYFPNLLFYGPPGTGKTTTIINLINSYQEALNQKNKGLMIHLNASDERGIDTILNQINQFVNSNSLFYEGMKFVVLDEVDYMTKNAQQALRYLLQNYTSGVRFCLICNYISRIDEGLQNEFLKLRFNQLPESDIIRFLQRITISENMRVDNDSLQQIQRLYRSDIRSMINFLQSNQTLECEYHVLDESVWCNLCKILSDKTILAKQLQLFVYNVSVEFNIDQKNIIKNFLNYIIRNRKELVSTKFLNFVENIMHFEECKNDHYVNYSLAVLSSLMRSDSEL